MKTVIKDGFKYEITDALAEVLMEKGTRSYKRAMQQRKTRVNPTQPSNNMKVNPQSMPTEQIAPYPQQTQTINKNPTVSQPAQQTNTNDKNVQQTNINDKNVQQTNNTQDVSTNLTSNDWNIIYDKDLFIEKEKAILKSIEPYLLENIKKLDNLIKKIVLTQYKDEHIDIANVTQVIEHLLGKNAQKYSGLLDAGYTAICYNQGLNINNGVLSDTSKNKQLTHPNANLNVWIAVALGNHIKTKVKAYLESVYGKIGIKSTMDEHDKRQIFSFASGYIDSSIKGGAMPMSDYVNMDVINDKNTPTEDINNAFSSMKSMLHELKVNTSSPLNSIYFSFFDKCIKMYEKILESNISSKKNMDAVYSIPVKNANIFAMVDKIPSGEPTLKDIQSAIFHYYNRFMKMYSENTQYFGRTLSIKYSNQLIKDMVSDKARIRYINSNASNMIKTNDVENIIDMSYNFFKQFYGVNRNTNEPSNKNTNKPSNKKSKKDNIDGHEYDEKLFLNNIIRCIDIIKEDNKNLMNDYIEEIVNAKSFNDLHNVYNKIFTPQMLRRYTVSLMTLVFEHKLSEMSFLEENKRKKKEYDKKRKDMSIEEHMHNFRLYMGRDPNEEDIKESKEFLYDLEQKQTQMKELLESSKEELKMAKYTELSVLWALPSYINIDLIKSLKDNAITKSESGMFMKKLFAYIELSEAWKKLEKNKLEKSKYSVIYKLLKELFDTTQHKFTLKDLYALNITGLVVPIFNLDTSIVMSIILRAIGRKKVFSSSQINVPNSFVELRMQVITDKTTNEFIGFTTVMSMSKLFNSVGKILDKKPSAYNITK